MKRNFADYPNRGLSGSSFSRDSGLGLITVSVDCGGVAFGLLMVL